MDDAVRIACEMNQSMWDRLANALEDLYTRFVAMLRTATLNTLQERTLAAYGTASATKGRTYLLAYHQATHLAMHCGQIRTIRNLYRKTRGEPARFFPENPSYPRQP